MSRELNYNLGFGNHFATEARSGALPEGQNIPQKAPLGLYPEQLTGTAFTAPRGENQRSWLYRTLPSVALNTKFELKPHEFLKMPPFRETPPPPDAFRWNPPSIPTEPTDFIEGLRTMAGNGAVNGDGCVVHVYVCNKSMTDRYFYNADGDFLIVPQEGSLTLFTELGIIELQPLEIAVIQRGMKFRVEVDGPSRGYICENLGTPFQLPGLGPIGANGLANPRDFKIPLAYFEEKTGDFELQCKFHGNIWTSKINHSPLNVVAWHGNYAPYKYDLRLFQTIGTISYDHPDPSIFTVLTSQTARAGTASIDFVIFPPRWMVAENSFRPPYFHRNIMSEYMGLIHGVYDAKIGGGFVPGGSSLHNCMIPHGPDKSTFDKATQAELRPEYYKDTMAFMFESRSIFEPTPYALNSPELDRKYTNCWQGYTQGDSFS